MKKLLKLLWTILCIVLLILFIISCFSAFISPAFFSYIIFFVLAFPYLFIFTLIAAFINLYVNKKLAFAILICIPPAFYNLSNMVAFNFPEKLNDARTDSSVFRIMTWNVQDFINLSEKNDIRSSMMQLIKQKNPDVLCLQEVTNVEGGRWRISIREELEAIGYKYHFFSNDFISSNIHDVVVTRGVVIFSKTPIKDSGRIKLSNETEPENLIYINTIFNNKLLRVYTAHLASYALFKDTVSSNNDIYEITYRRKRAIQYKLREIEALHKKEAEIIADTVSKAGFPIVYCGDMNTTPCSYTYRILRDDFSDAFLENGLGTGATFYKILPMLRIDYCFADKRLKVVNCAVIKEKLSDHYPVVTDIKWK